MQMKLRPCLLVVPFFLARLRGRVYSIRFTVLKEFLIMGLEDVLDARRVCPQLTGFVPERLPWTHRFVGSRS